MESAGRIAERYAADPKLRRLVQTVVPVSGLIAQGAATLSEDDYRAFAAIAAMPENDREMLLLSADRFTAEERAEAVVPIVRHQLLARYGMFGVRQCVDEIGSGRITSSPALVRHLSDLSGVQDLRQILVRQFGERAALLKVRSALEAVDRAAHEVGGSVGVELSAEVERITAGAHELVEVRLLNQLRLGTLKLKADELSSLERLIGGGSVATRLGCQPICRTMRCRRVWSRRSAAGRRAPSRPCRARKSRMRPGWPSARVKECSPS